MKLLWILLALNLLSSSLYAQSLKRSCQVDFTIVPPFYLANVAQGYGFKEKISVDFKDGHREIVTLKDQDSFIAKSTYENDSKLILQGDILVSHKSFDERVKEYWELFDNKNINKNSKHDFQVLYHNKDVSIRKSLVDNIDYAQDKEFVTVDSRHISKDFPMDQKFLLNKMEKTGSLNYVNSNLSKNQTKLSEGDPIKFVRGEQGTNDFGLFKVLKCSDGSVRYLVKRVDNDGEVFGNEFAIDSTQCGGLDAQLKTIDDDSFTDLMKLARAAKDLQFYSGQIFLSPANLPTNPYGLASLPLEFMDGWSHNTGPRNQYGGFDYLHVRREYWKGAERPGSDTWGKPGSLCSFMNIAKKWKSKCMNLNTIVNPDLLPNGRKSPNRRYLQCTIQLTDIAFYNPSSRLYSNGIDALGHRGHADGECFDIRPIRKDEHMAGSYWSDPKVNSTALNKELINHLKNMGATNILYNDNSAGATYSTGHDNHIHFCLPKSSRRALNNNPDCWD